MPAYVINIEEKTLDNNFFREVLFTAQRVQLVVMSLAPGEEIGLETHNDGDQFIRVDAGKGIAILDGEETIWRMALPSSFPPGYATTSSTARSNNL